VGLELAHYLDEMVQGKWVAGLQAALRLPPEMVENPNTFDFNLRVDIWPLTEMARVLRARAALTLDAGDAEAALRQLQDVYRLSRVVRYRTTLSGYLIGEIIERHAVQGMEEWLRQEKAPPAAQLQAQLAFLADEERQRPSLREALKVEEVAQRNMLREPAFVRTLFDPGMTEGAPGKEDMYLILLASQVPWEKERLRRRVNRMSARLAGALDFPFPIPRPRVLSPEGKTRAEIRAAMRDLMENEGIFTSIFHARRLHFGDQIDLCRFRALRLQTALVLYQVEQGKTAPTLAALVPRYFDTLPKDPYSGKDFRYRISEGETIAELGAVQTTGLPLGWHLWFDDGAAGPGMAGGAPGGDMAGGMPGGGGMAAFQVPFPPAGPGEEALGDPFASGLAGFIGLWAGPPGQNFLTPIWMLPGLGLGTDVVHQVRPGQGVLWSVGPDGVDDGGRQIAHVDPMQPNFGIDLVFIVPDHVRGGNR
jgi:hypothetical protein